ncbi:MAG TPA: DUF3379 family protein [Steroidobacteraceae bacterium]|jgi:hypothetical protein
MMACLEFRRRVGAEPAAAEAGVLEHRRDCPACARYQDELRAMDALIERALKVSLPAKPQEPVEAPADASRRRLLAIAASLVAGTAVGIVLLLSAPRASIAREVIGHIRHEPGTMDTTAPLTPAALAQVLDPDGTRLRPDVGDVTFAARCIFDGRVVPHLVVRTPGGPVTVLMLRHRTISEPFHIDEQGYEGVVMPAPKGSIAIVGQGIANLDAVAQKVFDAVDWGR